MSRYRNPVAFLLLAAIWGSAFAAIKAGLSYFPPVLFAALRYDIAGIVMLAYAYSAVEEWRPRTRPEWAAVATGAVLMIASYHAFLFVGEQGTTSAVAAVIVSSSPMLTAGCSRLLLPEESLSALGVVGLLLGLVGVGVLVRPDPSNLLSAGVTSKALVFCAALSFALGSVVTTRLDAGLPIETLEAWAMVGGAVVMHGVSLALPGESLAGVTWTPTAIAALAYLSVLASALGFLLYFDLHDRLGPLEINLVAYVAPVFAALTGWLVLGERIDGTTVVGFLVIVAGFALLKRRAIAAELEAAGPPA